MRLPQWRVQKCKVLEPHECCHSFLHDNSRDSGHLFVLQNALNVSQNHAVSCSLGVFQKHNRAWLTCLILCRIRVKADGLRLYTESAGKRLCAISKSSRYFRGTLPGIKSRPPLYACFGVNMFATDMRDDPFRRARAVNIHKWICTFRIFSCIQAASNRAGGSCALCGCATWIPSRGLRQSVRCLEQALAANGWRPQGEAN